MERIQQLTGVDIRRGDDGVHLQLALWLDAYRSVTIGVSASTGLGS